MICSAGGPGSGKGTQCDRIVRDFGYLHLSAGDLLRDEVKNRTEIGRECEQLMKDGKLVPVEVTLKLIKKAMKEIKNSAKGFLIDGFPRAVDQAEVFEQKVTLLPKIAHTNSVGRTLHLRKLCHESEREMVLIRSGGRGW